MSNIRAAIERKFPRYSLDGNLNLWCGSSRVLSGTGMATFDAENLVKQRNELINALITASELLVEAVPQPVETTPVVHKRWRV